MAERAARDDRRAVFRLEDHLLVVRMRDALLTHDKAGAHLDGLCAERKDSRHAARIRDAARTDDRHVDSVDDLRHECHSRDLADVAARLRALCNQGIDARAHEALRECDRCDNRDDLRANLLEGRHVFARVASARRDDGDLLLEHDLHDFLDVRAHEHDIDAERLIRPALALLDLCAQDLRRHVAGADDAEAAGIRDGRSELCRADPGHAALEDRVLYVE